MTSSCKRLVVIGAGAAGAKVAAKACRCDPGIQVSLIDRGRHIAYRGRGVPYLIAGEAEFQGGSRPVAGEVTRSVAALETSESVDILAEQEVTHIDRQAKEVEVRTMSSGDLRRLPYDQLVLAMGSTPIVPDRPGMDLANVFRLATMDDAEAILTCLSERRPRRVVCIGGGPVTLETVSGLTRRGLMVAIVPGSDRLLSNLDYEIAAQVRKEVEQNFVDVYTSEDVVELVGDDDGNVKGVRTDKRTLDADMVLVAKGAKPNVKLAEDAGLTIGQTGGIRVDAQLRTSDPDIFAAGDCIETVNLITGKPTYQPRGSTANKQGRVVGINVTGGRDHFPGVLGSMVLKVCDLNVGKVGLAETEARADGYDIETALVPAPDKADFMPDAKTIIIKLVAERGTGLLLGAQALGKGEVVKRIDVAASMLACGATVDTLSNLDLGSAPFFASVLDAIITTANVMRNKLEGRLFGVSPIAVKEKLDRGDDFVFLDVRTEDEYEERHIPGTVLIPQGELEARLAELPKAKEIISFCDEGYRAYHANLFLQANGFENVKLMDGSIGVWPYETEAGKYQA